MGYQDLWIENLHLIKVDSRLQRLIEPWDGSSVECAR
jgi:hypothetical protein